MRRGSKVGMIKAAIPLVGVIKLDGDAEGGAPSPRRIELPADAPKPSRGRARSPKVAEVGSGRAPAVPPAAEGDPAKKRTRRGGRGRGRGKPKAE
jgi:hypothetical protein